MSNRKLIALRLTGVLQSWGYDSEYTYRNSGLFPTKSAVLGMCCAAKGLQRGSKEEKNFLASMASSLMTAIAIPRYQSSKTTKWELNVRRIEDFHTVEKTNTAAGKPNPNAVMTYRQYLCDAAFIVLLEVDAALSDSLLSSPDNQFGLDNPKWGVWLGRKSCIPSAPVFVGVYENLSDVESDLLQGQAISQFTYQKEVNEFSEGGDSLRDIPLNFAIDSRLFNQRRVMIHEADKIS